MHTSNRKSEVREDTGILARRVAEERAYVRRANQSVNLLLQGKWQVHVLCALSHGPIRIGRLGRAIPGASKKVLSQILRRLEADGIVIRKDLSERVLHVEYELRQEIHDSIISLLDHLSAWAAGFLALESVNDRTSRSDVHDAEGGSKKLRG
jgi:DNA-binding HxlR family transcriptional regulator